MVKSLISQVAHLFAVVAHAAINAYNIGYALTCKGRRAGPSHSLFRHIVPLNVNAKAFATGTSAEFVGRIAVVEDVAQWHEAERSYLLGKLPVQCPWRAPGTAT